MIDLTTILTHVFFFVALYFEVFLLITFFERFNTASTKEKKIKRYPTVAIAVPAYNEEIAVVKTINSLLAVNYPKDKLTIIGVDDGSKDGTWQAMQQFANNQQVVLHTQPNGGKHAAVNWGIEHSDAEIFGCLDADSFVDPEALNEIIRTFESDPELMAVTPAIKISNPQSIFQYIQKAEYDLSIFIRRTFSFLDGLFVTPGPLSLFKREVFEQIGLYKGAHNTEDLEMALRMQSRHMRIGNAHTAFVYTHGPRTFRALIKQRIRWVYGFLKNLIDYRFMIFRPKYGNIGMLILPITMFSIVTALYFFYLFLFGLTRIIWHMYVKYTAVGITPPSTPTIDWFYINTQSATILTIILIALSVWLVVIGKQLSKENRIFSYDLLLYVLFYGFLAPVWLMQALYRVVVSKKTSWTGEIDAGGR